MPSNGTPWVVVGTPAIALHGTTRWWFAKLFARSIFVCRQPRFLSHHRTFSQGNPVNVEFARRRNYVPKKTDVDIENRLHILLIVVLE
jgi:hypothetical protein